MREREQGNKIDFRTISLKRNLGVGISTSNWLDIDIRANHAFEIALPKKPHA